jgi:hypothetical protein
MDMGFLDKLLKSFSGGGPMPAYPISVQCNRCFQSIEVILKFDSRRSLKEKEVHGGKFVED